MARKWKYIMLSALSFFFLFQANPCGGAAVPFEEAEGCLECHGRKNLVKGFESGETLTASVSGKAFFSSVHGSFACSECHRDFSGDKHPQRRFRSLEQYRVQASRACLRCHTLERQKSSPVHRTFLKAGDGKGHLCTNCHGAHAVARVRGGMRFTGEEIYCLGCHGKETDFRFRNGEKVSLSLDASKLRSSAHARLSCSDCHFGFSSDEHPQRTFMSRREYTLASSETCRRCHFDKYTKTLESTHNTVLRQGRLEAPVCIDCHGSHEISPLKAERTSIVERCRKCHSRVYEVYAASVHGSALLTDSGKDVPICIDCHRAHDIRNPLTPEYHERVPEMCGNCHGDSSIAGKYGLSTEVVQTYLSDFHGVTLGFYRKQTETLSRQTRPIAVCTDCHGIHDIRSTRGMSAETVKANLVKRCLTCHKGAPKNFPEAWLSHYAPGTKKASLVYFINVAYGLFSPVLVIGIFLQIVLHAWRYAKNR